MKHPTAEQLSAFHDGIAGARTLVAIEEHVSECAECHDVLASLDRQDHALSAMLTHDPGDAHFEALADRIERRIETEPRRSPAARALRIVLDALLGAAEGAVSTLGGWLVSFWNGLKAFHAPEWAGALVALVVATGLVLINMKHPAAPILRDHALDQRARQTAGRETDELRGPAPQAGGETAREDKDRSRAPMQREIAPPALPPQLSAPSAGGVMKQPLPSSRAYPVKRTASGEEEPVRKAEGAFAKAPPAALGERAGSKPRLALPLEENRPRVEGGAPGAAKEAAEIQDEKNLSPATKSAAGSPTAQLPPEPESSRPAREAGAPEPAAASAVAPSAQEETRADRGTIRVCGVVKDAGGRPVPSATVTLVSQGSGVTSDAEGGFCIEGLPGEHTISVIAVGFGPLRLDVRFVSGAPPLALSLIPVSVLGEGEALRGKLRMLQGAPLTGSPGASQSMTPDSLERVEAQAMRLTLEAARAGSVPRYEAAAAEWERVRDHTPEGAANLDARFRIAEARYHAWALAPTPRRGSAADEALTSYLVRAPLGARRNTATVWLGRVKS